MRLAWVLLLGGCATTFVPPQGPVLADRGIAYLKEGRCELAEQSCRLALEYSDGYPLAWHCLGLVELRCRNAIEAAKDHFKHALSIDPDFVEAHVNLGVCLFQASPPDYEAAIEESRAALAIDPGHLHARANLGTWLARRGFVATEKGAPEAKATLAEARAQLIRLLELDPSNFEAHGSLGLVALAQKDLVEAEQQFGRCLEIDAGNPACAYNLGNTLLEAAKCKDAIVAYVTALRSSASLPAASPDRAIVGSARQNLAAAYGLCAKTDGAIAVFLDQIKSDPGNAARHFDLARIYAERGELERADAEWEATIALDPKYCPAYRLLAEAADRVLDSERTVKQCRSYLECGGEDADWCRARVRQLEESTNPR